ncbi:hypothetical protein R0H17_19335 [Phytobacter diazotrophicus]|uniref:hypothetical protein n=1 Tax=Phytobacter diazotrophicus TaxID=395631 RepID=UPI00293657C9|nr:hypothetical protein [Phytobacter diazotrophicus]MDV2903790.1 hypothetical protein [Phytobacter diazotrophicus]
MVKKIFVIFVFISSFNAFASGYMVALSDDYKAIEVRNGSSVIVATCEIAFKGDKMEMQNTLNCMKAKENKELFVALDNYVNTIGNGLAKEIMDDKTNPFIFNVYQMTTKELWVKGCELGMDDEGMIAYLDYSGAVNKAARAYLQSEELRVTRLKSIQNGYSMGKAYVENGFFNKIKCERHSNL